MLTLGLKQRRWLLKFGIIGGTLVVAAALVVLPLRFLASSHADELPVYWELPAFSFTDQLGRTVTSEDLRGKVIVANFIFTNCVLYCPTVLSPRMQELHQRLRSDGLLGRDVILLSFSVDPEQDTPEKLQVYAEKYGADPEVWRFLTGDLKEIERVVIMGLKLGFLKNPQPFEHTHPDGSVHSHKYDVAHTNRFILVDRQGQVRALYDGVYDWKLDKIMGDVQRVVME